MKNIFLLLLFLVFFACEKNSFEKENATFYKGKMTRVEKTFRGNELHKEYTIIDEDFDLVLAEGNFRRYLTTSEGCDGTYEISNNQLIATTTDCDCMCFCIPEIDCPGDPFLGTFDIQMMTDTKLVLYLFFENQSVENVSFIIETRIELEEVI